MSRLAAFAVLLLVMTSGPARADAFLTPFIGYNFGGDSSNCGGLTDCSPRRTSYGVSVGAMGTSVGLEEDFSYTKDFFGAASGPENSVFSAMSNLLFLGAPASSRTSSSASASFDRACRSIKPASTAVSSGTSWAAA